MNRFRKGAASLLLGLLVAAARPAAPEEDRRGGMVGPIPLRVISPFGLLFYQFTPERASNLGRGVLDARFEFSESNILIDSEFPEPEYSARIDIELARFNLNLRYGVTEQWDLGLEIPAYYTYDGFMDHFIRKFEDFVSEPKIRRLVEDRNSFNSEVSRNREVFLRGAEDRFGFGDLAVTAKRGLWSQDGWLPALGLRGAIKAPTGDEDVAFGSGRFDAALGVAAEWDFHRWAMIADLQSTFPIGNRLEGAGLDARPIASGSLDLEYRTSARFSWHLQFASTMGPFSLDGDRGPSPFDTSKAQPLTSPIYQIAPGFAWRIRPAMTLLLGFVENFSSDDVASDFTFFMTFSCRFGSGR
ncbi:MAG: DUF3187 family protein [Planctomycetes bacterium]|nr:DUF3187 family protein [Planctomycetota bacterium]